MEVRMVPISRTREKVVGSGVKRREDPRLISGHGKFIDDIAPAGEYVASFVRSPHSHAKVRSVDTSLAERQRGVKMVFTARDLLGAQPKGIPTSVLPPGSRLPVRYPLALDEVNYVGEPVAMVVGENKYLVQDAAELVRVEYEPLDAVVDPEKAIKDDSARVHKEFPDNLAYKTRVTQGDPDLAFQKAHLVVKEKLVIQRLAAVPLETRGLIASFDPIEGFLTIWTSTQAPHIIRTWYAKYLGIPENKIRVVAPDVGGGFGVKCQLYSDELSLCMAAIKLAKPVKWISDRMEDLMSTVHARDQVHDIELAVDRTGTILGLRDRIVADCGAYLHFFTIANSLNTLSFITGNYDIRNVEIDVDCVFTNTMSIDAYRGAGIPEAICVIERMVDEASRALGVDPTIIRSKNFVKSAQFPYTNACGTRYDSGDYERTLRRALEMVGYEELRKRQAELFRTGKLMGIGVASYVLLGGFGPSKAAPTRWGGYESAKVRVDSDGEITLYTGTSGHGQGVDTALAQIVADELQVGLDEIVVLHGDTQTNPYGIGTHGSRSAVVGGHSVLMACEKVKTKAKTLASHMLGAAVDDITFEDGKFHIRGSFEKELSLKQIAEELTFMKNSPVSIEPVLEATAFYEPEEFTVAFGTHVAVVDVDAETGNITITKYVGVDDCGRVLNPMIVEGQMQGGVVQGIGQALYEEMIFDENGQPLTTTLSDYAIPTAVESPNLILDRTETPAPSTLGVKGVGEAGPVASVAALSNAVADALRLRGAKANSLPFRSDAIWTVLNAK